MEHNIKKVTILLLSIAGTAAIIVSSTTALPSSPLHLIMAQQQQQQNVVQSSSSSIDPPTSPSSSSPSSPSSLANVFKRIENSVVQITSTRSDPNQVTIINGVPATGRSTALGSGFVYDNQGHIITNHHVIDGATTADVTFTDGNTYSAKVIGKDPDADIAILQITDNFSEEKVMPLPIANSSSLRPGDQLIAIGNPFGLSGTITTGIVSGEGRLLPNPDTGFSIPNIIQTDAAINPGNSGGPLLNMQGQVIGMNTAILSRTGSYSGVGFAIPSNTIAKEVPLLIKGGTYVHPWLGIAGGKITPDIAQSAGLPRNYKGVVVGSVQPGSPADKAGLQPLTQDISGSNTHIGDIITAIDGHPTRQIDDIINYVDSNKNVGDNVKLTINRNGQTTDVTATLQARPNTISQQSQQQQQQPQQPGLGPIPELPQLPPDSAPLLP
ncbi:MAG TPA: trypsin-like peptidase domain-containing protein [Nitrososphaeraceae archaeon]|nr:trypsin-like peptidase domain-containing protein [Nitrososphaeraceae archaeon]